MNWDKQEHATWTEINKKTQYGLGLTSTHNMDWVKQEHTIWNEINKNIQHGLR